MTLLQTNLGTAANDVHFQAYILEGIVWWNSQRSIAAIDSPESNIRSFDPKLRLKLKCLRSAVLDKSTDIDFHPLAAYTGELFGIEYLYSEMGSNLTLGVNIDIEIEEGLNDEDDFFTFFPEEEDCLDSELDVDALYGESQSECWERCCRDYVLLSTYCLETRLIFLFTVAVGNLFYP
jgi:hypothetical protein